jgi:hypothetical protein
LYDIKRADPKARTGSFIDQSLIDFCIVTNADLKKVHLASGADSY